MTCLHKPQNTYSLALYRKSVPTLDNDRAMTITMFIQTREHILCTFQIIFVSGDVLVGEIMRMPGGERSIGFSLATLLWRDGLEAPSSAQI